LQKQGGAKIISKPVNWAQELDSTRLNKVLLESRPPSVTIRHNLAIRPST
jgi:hypothetical protein